MNEDLPGLLGEIAEIAGFPAAFAIAERVGGHASRYLPVPPTIIGS